MRLVQLLFSQPFQLSVLFGILNPLALGQDWNRFRGPNGTGRAAAGIELPTSWSNTENLAWKVPVLPGSSSPVVAEDRVFITGFSGYGMPSANQAAPNEEGKLADLRLHVQAYSLADGTRLWDYDFQASEHEQQATSRIIDHGYASPTPCTDGESVFASFGPSGIVALDMEGQLKWSRDIGSNTAGFGAAASPIEFHDLVIVNASIESGALIAFSKETGEIVWRLGGVERAWTTPAIVELVDGSAELVLHFKGQIVGVDPLTGKRLWSCQGIPDYVVPVPVVDGQVVYFSGGRQNRTIAVRAGGRGDVTSSHKLWEVNKGANVTTPLFHEGHLYWSHDKAFSLSMDAVDGSVVEQKRFDNRDRVYASVVYGNGKLFMTQRNGVTLVLAAEPGYRELARNQLGDPEVERFNATPALSSDSLIHRSTHFLYRIRKSPSN